MEGSVEHNLLKGAREYESKCVLKTKMASSEKAESGPSLCEHKSLEIFTRQCLLQWGT